MGTTGLDSLKLTGDLRVDGTVSGGAISLDDNLTASDIDARSYETIRLTVAGAAATGANKAFAVCGVSCTIVDARIVALTGPIGSALTVDINKDGTTIFTTQANRPSIADGQTASPQAVPDVVSLAVGSVITVDIDAIGSGTAGSNLAIVIRAKAALVD